MLKSLTQYKKMIMFGILSPLDYMQGKSLKSVSLQNAAR